MAARLTDAVRAFFSRAHRSFDLGGFAIQQVLCCLLHLALEGEVGNVRRMLTDEAGFAGQFTLIAAEYGVVLRLAQALKILGPAGERVIGRGLGRTLAPGWLHLQGSTPHGLCHGGVLAFDGCLT